MSQVWRATLAIARRDYVATVFSRLFLLFLLGPLFPLAFGGVFGAIGARTGDEAPARPAIVVGTTPDLRPSLAAARARLARRLGDGALPDLVAPGHAGAAVGTLGGPAAAPRLMLAGDAPEGIEDDVALILDEARLATRAGAAPPPVRLRVLRAPAAAHDGARDRETLAKAAQTTMFVLILILAGMLLSNLIEEKSNKVIEVLAAAVPVDAIFLGKLIGMLAISFTGIAVWGLTAGGAVALAAPQLLGAIARPAVGWPLFVALGFAYFATSYLLLGAILLGIGSRANSPREVQTLSMPVTMAQLLLFGFASVDLRHPDSWASWAAAIFPWSSPLAMLARAAALPAVWPHLLALAWQAGWLVLAVRFTASRFRRGVLKSGPPRRRRG